MNPALRLCEPEGLAAVGLENLFAEPVRGDLAEMVKFHVSVGYGSQRASEWFTDPRIS
jgi:hypothetical protein